MAFELSPGFTGSPGSLGPTELHEYLNGIAGVLLSYERWKIPGTAFDLVTSNYLVQRLMQSIWVHIGYTLESYAYWPSVGPLEPMHMALLLKASCYPVHI